MNDRKADLGRELLLSENATHTLEVEYNNDMEQIFIQLRNKADDKCTVLDADSILEQAYDIITKKHDDIMTQYVIHMAVGNEFTGTPEDIARWYCKLHDIKLYIEPDNNGKENLLWASFPDEDTGKHNSNTVTHIAYFENDECDIEAGYRLFFHEYMLEADNPDYELTALS